MAGNIDKFQLETAKAYINSLQERADNHRAVRHPYLQRLAKGDVPNVLGAIQDLTFQYQAYSGDFIRYLTATIAQLTKREHRAALLQNLTEESGQIHEEDIPELEKIGIDVEWIRGIAHPHLYIRFLDAVALMKNIVKRTRMLMKLKSGGICFLISV